MPDGTTGDASRLTVTFDRPMALGVTALAVRVRGQLDTHTADTLCHSVRAGLYELDRQEREDAVVQARALLVDLRGVDVDDAAGLDGLVAVAEEASARSRPIRLIVDRHEAGPPLPQLADHGDLLRTYTTLDAAILGPGAPRRAGD